MNRKPARTATEASHNHHHCVTDALTSADRLAEARGLRLTPLRRHVLEILAGSHRPLGAYEILAELARRDGMPPGGKLAPPTVYRALAFLTENGLAHRIASRNAFLACFTGDATDSGMFLICQSCGAVTERKAGPLKEVLEREAAAAGFAALHPMIEIEGLCAACAGRP